MNKARITRAAATLRAYLGGKRYEWTGGARARRVPLRWLRRPSLAPGDRLCLFVAMPHAGRLMPHALDHIEAWRASGYRVIVALPVESLDDGIDLSPLAPADGIVLRINRGYDFGAWAALVQQIGQATLGGLAMLAVANDSVLGPSSAFGAMVERAEACGADLIGLTESRQLDHHFQSFVLFFSPRAVASAAFARFWRAVRSGDRDYVVKHYEARLRSRLTSAGLSTHALFADGASGGNPTLERWRALIDHGFPFIKVQLLRDNPYGEPIADWRAVAAQGGFDAARLDAQVTALTSGRRPWQVA